MAVEPITGSSHVKTRSDPTHKVVLTDENGVPYDSGSPVSADSGHVFVAGVRTEVKRAKIDGGSHDVVAAVTGKKIRVLSWRWTIDAAGTVKWQSGASTDLTGAMNIAGSGGMAEQDYNGIIETVAGEKLNVVLVTATSIDGSLNYVEV